MERYRSCHLGGKLRIVLCSSTRPFIGLRCKMTLCYIWYYGGQVRSSTLLSVFRIEREDKITILESQSLPCFVGVRFAYTQLTDVGFLRSIAFCSFAKVCPTIAIS